MKVCWLKQNIYNIIFVVSLGAYMSEKLASYKMSVDEARSKLYDYYNNAMCEFVS